MIEWNINPEILNLGPFSIRYYSLAFIVAFILGYIIMRWIYKQENKPFIYIDKLLTYVFLGILIGARLGHCLFYDFEYFLLHPIEIFLPIDSNFNFIGFSGLASHGAVIGILLAVYLFSKKNPDQPYLWLLDRLSIVVALGGSFVRLGNLFNSEIIGKPANVPWAFIFIREDNIPRHPAQIYESLAYILVFIILFFIYKKYKKDIKTGLLTGLFFIGVFGARFFIEFFKENQVAFEDSMLLNMGQILSIPLVITGIVLLGKVYLKNNSPTQSRQAAKK
jgi:phosphatidylglycerol:prolipoprotein diacylglycerol transferase